MRRMLASALVLGIFSTVGLIGCGEEASVKTETDVSTPGGTTTTTTEKKVETTGDNPPPAAGTTPAHHALSDRSSHALRSRGGRFFLVSCINAREN